VAAREMFWAVGREGVGGITCCHPPTLYPFAQGARIEGNISQAHPMIACVMYKAMARRR
jgi:hypothetical protein